jgi:hypothetical protein
LETEMAFDEDSSLGGLRIGLVEARGINWSAPAAGGSFAAIIAEAKRLGEALIQPSRKTAVRSMLRYGAYKPAGRGKPSNEYLLQAALEDEFPSVNFFVDAANIVSLGSGYPISIIDRGKAGAELLLRRGREGESYVFNAGGQSIDLSDLLCVCKKIADGFIPTANPVRDSMATKIFPGASDIVAIIYAPEGPEGQDLESACAELAAYLAKAAEDSEWRVITA